MSHRVDTLFASCCSSCLLLLVMVLLCLLQQLLAAVSDAPNGCPPLLLAHSCLQHGRLTVMLVPFMLRKLTTALYCIYVAVVLCSSGCQAGSVLVNPISQPFESTL
jgi:hypothetical protein